MSNYFSGGVHSMRTTGPEKKRKKEEPKNRTLAVTRKKSVMPWSKSPTLSGRVKEAADSQFLTLTTSRKGQNNDPRATCRF